MNSFHKSGQNIPVIIIIITEMNVSIQLAFSCLLFMKYRPSQSVYRIEGDAQHGNGAIFFYFNINNLKPVVISLSFTPIRSAVYCCVFGVARLDNLCVSSLIGICTLRHREVTQSFSLCTYFYSKHLGPSSYNYTYCMSEFGTIYEHKLSPILLYSCGVPQSFPDQL